MIKRALLAIISILIIIYSISYIKNYILNLSLYSLFYIIILALGFYVLFLSIYKKHLVHTAVAISFILYFIYIILYSYLQIELKLVLLIAVFLEMQIAVWPIRLIYLSSPVYLFILIYILQLNNFILSIFSLFLILISILIDLRPNIVVSIMSFLLSFFIVIYYYYYSIFLLILIVLLSLIPFLYYRFRNILEGRR
jgi:hypothetical protein